MSSPIQDAASRWAELEPAFLAVHRGRLNVALHLVATPLGFYATFAALAALSPLLSVALLIAWAAALASRVRPDVRWAVLGFFLVLAGLALWMPLGLLSAVVLAAVGYGLQEAAHKITGEASFQSGYMNDAGWARFLAEQTFFLPALVLQAARQHDWLSMFVAHDRVVHTRLGPTHAGDIDRLQSWVLDQKPAEDHTTHWWRLDLPATELAAFDRIRDADEIRQAFHRAYGDEFDVASVDGMNEVYVAGPDQNLTSDTVFHMSHVDGPIAVFPFASVYRCMVGISPNGRVATKFPMTRSDYERGRSIVLSTGDVAGFDFHRELHYIETDPEGPELGRRITLKLHYVVFPRYFRKWGELLGRLSTRYNITARNVFLGTLTPDSLREKLGAAWVVATTKTFETIGRYAGNTNAAYVAVLALLNLVLGTPLPLLVGASFVHYLIYIATFRQRTEIAYGTFVRDAVFFKSVSMAQLAFWYLYGFEGNVLSLLLVVGGFGLSAWAARKLGWVRTYFGTELGQLATATRVSGFPYGTIPHPMILGAIIGLIGVGCVPAIAERFPWLIPTHIAFYLIHATQEALDRRAPAPYVYSED